jgi:hypothetical protein
LRSTRTSNPDSFCLITSFVQCSPHNLHIRRACIRRTVFYVPFFTAVSKRTTTVSYVKTGQIYVFNISIVTVPLNFPLARLRILHLSHRFIRGFSKGIFTGASRASCNLHKTIFTCSCTACGYLGLLMMFLRRGRSV